MSEKPKSAASLDHKLPTGEGQPDPLPHELLLLLPALDAVYLGVVTHQSVFLLGCQTIFVYVVFSLDFLLVARVRDQDLIHTHLFEG